MADVEAKHDTEQLSEPRKQIFKKKHTDHASKYSGSRKSSLETAVTNAKFNLPKFENTYKISPDEHKRFYAYKLQPQILKTLKNHVEKYETEGKSNSNLTRDLADAIRIDAKNMGFQRYKLVVFVTVGDNVGQDVRVASRCLWNPEFDNCISVTHKTKSLWATATVYIIYND